MSLKEFKIIKEFKNLFKENSDSLDLINMYLVFMGLRSGCLIHNINLFYQVPKEASLEIHYARYPGYSHKSAGKHHDYPLITLKNSWVSKLVSMNSNEFTEEELGSYLGFNCYEHNWKNIKINKYEISYSLINNGTVLKFYVEVCSRPLELDQLIRIKFMAIAMTEALKLINSKFKVKHDIIFHKPLI